MLYLRFEGPYPMMKIELDNETFELLKEAQKSLRDLGGYETMDSVVRELCNVYFWRGE